MKGSQSIFYFVFFGQTILVFSDFLSNTSRKRKRFFEHSQNLTQRGGRVKKNCACCDLSVWGHALQNSRTRASREGFPTFPSKLETVPFAEECTTRESRSGRRGVGGPRAQARSPHDSQTSESWPAKKGLSEGKISNDKHFLKEGKQRLFNANARNYGNVSIPKYQRIQFPIGKISSCKK